VLLGDGSQRTEVERLISSWGLAKTVWLPGAVAHEQLPQYFQAADFYASFAQTDGSSISLLEAMATGLPVIATDCASNREWIGDNASGLVVPAGDIRAMADALVEVASMTMDRRRMTAARNRAIIEQRADWKRNVKKLLDAYEGVLPQAEEVRT